MLKIGTFLAILFSSLAFTKLPAFEKVQDAFINVGDAKIFCRTMGKGKPLIVVHGGPGLSQDYLQPQLNKLAESHFVIFYDQRGCGRSTGTLSQDTINIKTYVEDLDKIRKAFGFDTVSILGHSWGGFVTMHYAISHPESVNKLILSNSLPAFSEDFALFIKEYMHRTSPFQEELSLIQKESGFQQGDVDANEEKYYRLIFRTYCFKPEHADLLSLRMTPSAFVNGTKVYGLFWENTFSKSFNLHESLKSLRIPTLIVHGDTDPIPSITAENLVASKTQNMFY